MSFSHACILKVRDLVEAHGSFKGDWKLLLKNETQKCNFNTDFMFGLALLFV